MLNIISPSGNANQSHNEVIALNLLGWKERTNEQVLARCGGTGRLTHCWWKCTMVKPLQRTVWQLLKERNTELPYDPASPLLGLYTMELKWGLEQTLIC